MRLSCLPKVTQLVDSRATLETAWLLQILAYVTQHTRCDLLTPFLCHLCKGEVLRLPLFSNHWILSILALEIQRDPIVKKAFLKRKGNKAEGHYFYLDIPYIAATPIKKWHIRDHICTQSFVTVI